MTAVTLFSHGLAPNPPKVAILLEELGVTYKIVKKETGSGTNGMKTEEFFKINPNGRVPALIDHTNNDFIVWESGAILLYVAERFDQTGKFAGKTLEERAEVWQWLMFQMSGIGPIQGQHFWFKFFHSVKDLDQSVYDRYRNECYRVFAVLEKQLEKHEWIAIDRFTVADMANYPWLNMAPRGDLDMSQFPKVQAYVERIKELPSVKQAYARLSAD